MNELRSIIEICGTRHVTSGQSLCVHSFANLYAPSHRPPSPSLPPSHHRARVTTDRSAENAIKLLRSRRQRLAIAEPSGVRREKTRAELTGTRSAATGRPTDRPDGLPTSSSLSARCRRVRRRCDRRAMLGNSMNDVVALYSIVAC